MTNSIRYPLVLALVCLGAAAAVGGAYTITRQPIQERKQLEEKQAVERVAPKGIDHTEALDDSGTLKGLDAAGNVIGYIARGEARGYAGPVVVMVGFSPDLHVTGVVVTSQNETPGLGAELGKTTSTQTIWGLVGLDKSEVACNCWLDQFKGMSGADADPDARKFDAKTGATITSNAIARGIHQAYQKLETLLKDNPS